MLGAAKHLAPQRVRSRGAGCRAVRILTMQRRADITKARTELGYEPTSVRDALREQYEFFGALGWIDGFRRPA